MVLSRSSNWAKRVMPDSTARAAPWIERTARLGFAAKALLYVVIGILALQAARGAGGRTTGSSGALVELLDKPFGRILLVLMGLGLMGYATWRVVEGFVDAERKGSSPKGLALRVSSVARGLFHAALAVQAVRIASADARGGSDGAAERTWTARALDAPFGKWLVALIGISVVGYGLYQLYIAYRARLDKQLDVGSLRREAGTWAIRISRFGIGARGVVFAMVGFLVIKAGLDADASKAGGVGDALRALGDGLYGRWILGCVAAGLVAYGAYEVIEARYRRILTE